MTHLSRRPDGCRFAATLLIACCLWGTSSANAGTVVWDGGGGDALWGNPLNWSGDALPGPGDAVVIPVVPRLNVLHDSGATTIASLETQSPLTVSGGSLQVAGTAVASAGATVTLDGGTLVGGTWDVTSGTLRATSANLNTLVGVAIVGDIELDAIFSTVRVQGGLAVEGTVALTGPGARLVFEGDQIVSTGTFLLQGVLGLPARLAIDGDATVTLGSKAVVHAINANLGGSVFAPGTDTLVSAGAIVIDAASADVRWLGDAFVNEGTLDVALGQAQLAPQNWSNEGTITVGKEAKLQLGGSFWAYDMGTIVNKGSTIDLVGVLMSDGVALVLDEQIGTLRMLGGAILGGEIKIAGGALTFSSDSGNLIAGSHIDGDIALANAQDRLHYEGSLWIDGTLTLAGSGSQLVFDGPAPKFTHGTIAFAPPPPPSVSPSVVISSGGVLTVATNALFQGGPGKFLGNTATMIADGTFVNDVPSTSFWFQVRDVSVGGMMTASGPDTKLIIDANSLTSSGLLAVSEGKLSIDSEMPWTSTGSVTATNGATVQVTGAASSEAVESIDPGGGTVVVGCAIDNTGHTLVLDQRLGTWSFNGATVTGGSLVSVGGPLPVVYALFKDVSVVGDVSVVSSIGGVATLLVDGTTTTAAGEITLGPKAKLRAVSPGPGVEVTLAGLAIHLAGTATDRPLIETTGLDGVLTLASDVLIHGGEGRIDVGGALTNQGTIRHDEPGTTLFLGGGAFFNEGTIATSAGTTVVNPKGGFTNAGLLAIEGGGAMSVADSVLTLLPGARLAIAPSAAGQTALQGASSALLDGVLEVSLAPGYFPAPGDVVTAVSAASVSGTFASVESCVGIAVTYAPPNVVNVTFDGVVPGDLDGDGSVGGADLGLLLAAWGPCGQGCCLADLDGDGAVGGADLGLLLGNWG